MLKTIFRNPYTTPPAANNVSRPSSLWSKLLLGFFFCALSNSFEIHSLLGSSPWSVFHQGLAAKLSITFGQASILCSMIIILLVSFTGLKMGLATILNMLVIGWMVDFFDHFHMVTDAVSLSQGFMMIFLSMVFNGIGSCLYISCGIGCGPRDGLMSILVQKTGLPVALIRSAIEASVFLIGWQLGGRIGIGTAIIVIFVGPCVSRIYKIMHFDIAAVRHQTLAETLHLNKYNAS